MNKFGYVLAPKQLVEKKMKILYAYRESPDNENDSGWRFFSGKETDKFVNNPDNIGIYDIETILEIDKDVRQIIKNQEFCAYEQNQETKQFRMVQ